MSIIASDVGAEVNTAIGEIANLKLAITSGNLKLESQVHNFVASRLARLLGREQLCHYMCCR